MLRKVTVAVVTFLAAFSFAGVAVASHMITGKVISLDPPEKILTIKAHGQEMTFNVLDKAVKALPSVKRGDKVTLSYFQTFGPPTAESVTKG